MSLHFTRSVFSPPGDNRPPFRLSRKYTRGPRHFKFPGLVTRIPESELLSGAVRGRRKKPPTTSPSDLLPLVHAGPRERAQLLTQNGGRVASRVRHSLPAPRGPAAKLTSLDPQCGKACADDETKMELLTSSVEACHEKHPDESSRTAMSEPENIRVPKHLPKYLTLFLSPRGSEPFRAPQPQHHAMAMPVRLP